MFDIAMNTKGALNFNDLSSLGGGSAAPAPMNNPVNQNISMNQGMPMGNQQGYSQNNQGIGVGGQSNNTQGFGQPNMNQGMPNNQGMTNQNMYMGNQFNQGMQAQSMPNQNMQGQNMQQGFNQNNVARPANPAQGPVNHYEAKAKGGVILKKGGKTSLSKMVGAGGKLQNIDVCLGWDVGAYGNYDLDSSCFMLGDNGKVIGDDWFVFYNQPVSPDGSIRHNGDNKTGAGDGDDEIISIDLNRLSPQVKKLAFVITINEAIENGYSFKNIANAYVRVVDKMSNKELAFFNLSDYYDGITAMTVCEIYNHNGDWKINPVGNGLKDTDLMGLCGFYGVNVAG